MQKFLILINIAKKIGRETVRKILVLLITLEFIFNL